MTRTEELLAIVPDDSKELVTPTITEVVFLEGQLDKLKKLPFIKVNPSDSEIQKATPASKMYKEMLQQYINAVKLIEGVIYRDKRLEGEQIEDSPLRKWFKEHE